MLTSGRWSQVQHGPKLGCPVQRCHAHALSVAKHAVLFWAASYVAQMLLLVGSAVLVHMYGLYVILTSQAIPCISPASHRCGHFGSSRLLSYCATVALLPAAGDDSVSEFRTALPLLGGGVCLGGFAS